MRDDVTEKEIALEGRYWVRAKWMDLIEPVRYMQNAFNRRNA